MAKITARKTGGFGEYCWTVFIDGKAFKSDIHKVQVSYYKDLAKIEVDRAARPCYNSCIR